MSDLIVEPGPLVQPVQLYPDPIPGIIPFGTVTVFAGAPGVGKTAMLAEWIQRWREGRTIWGHATNPATAYYYIAADRQWASHQKWFELVGYPDIVHYSIADDGAFDRDAIMRPGEALKLLGSIFARLGIIPGAHLFLDPMSPIFVMGSPNDPRAVARTLLEFSAWCQTLKINITATAHFGKQKGDTKERYVRPQDRIAGSGAFSGFSDTQVYLVDPEPPLILQHTLGWNPRHSRPQEFACTRSENGLFIPHDVMKDDLHAANVCDQLSETGATSLSVIIERSLQQHGHSRATVKRALARLLLDGRVVKVGHGKYQRVKIH